MAWCSAAIAASSQSNRHITQRANFRGAGCQSAAVDGDVLRLGRFHRACCTARSRGFARVITAYHRAVAEIAQELEGFVAKYMGDGVLVYFGYPRAHENDAEHAVRAGLGIVAAVGRLDIGLVKMKARVGIATGLVVVGDLIGAGSAQEQSVIGETPNAARLQALAEPDGVVISASRAGWSAIFPNIAISVTWKSRALRSWCRLGRSASGRRREPVRGIARLGPEPVDRPRRRNRPAIASMGRRQDGRRAGVLVSGESGLGKSRITAALEERLQDEPVFPMRYFCSPYRQDSALYPSVDQIGRAAGFARTDLSAAKLKKPRLARPRVIAGRRRSHSRRPFVVARFGGLASAKPQSATKKERTLEALIRRLEGLGGGNTVVMID